MKGPWGHLTYCLNVHPGETWADVCKAVEGPALEVKRALAPHQPFGLGLRLSAAAVRDGLKSEELTAFKARLDDLGMYVFTINGFPYGPFHGTAVKDQVYVPDWSHVARCKYTADLARFLAHVLPDGCRGSISTVPLGFRAHTGQGSEGTRLLQMARALGDLVLELAALEQSSGRWIQLALEPEPGCLLETSVDVVTFFEQYLYTSDIGTRIGTLYGGGRGAAVDLVRRHLGVCVDTCHSAVEFEQAREAAAILQNAGISIAKLQLSCGLRVCPITDEALRALRAFDEPVYLHQVVALTSDGDLVRVNDLDEAFRRAPTSRDQEWRVHFHVPIHVTEYSSFTSTRASLEDWLALHGAHALSDHLEVETYTWDVLPERSGNLVHSLIQELEWVKGQLSK